MRKKQTDGGIVCEKETDRWRERERVREREGEKETDRWRERKPCHNVSVKKCSSARILVGYVKYNEKTVILKRLKFNGYFFQLRHCNKKFRFRGFQSAVVR